MSANWIDQSDRFWYLDAHDELKEFVLVDPARNRQGPAFDHGKMASALSSASRKTYIAGALPFARFDYQDGGSAIAFKVAEVPWRCDLKSYVCEPTDQEPGAREGEVLSPNGRWAVSSKANNLWLRDTRSGEESALTQDGQERNAYGRDVRDPVTATLLQESPTPWVQFSPDSKRLLSFRADLRQLNELAVIQSIPGRPPYTHRYAYPTAGDLHLPQIQMFLFDLENKTSRAVATPFSRAASYDTTMCWSEDSTEACFTVDERGYKSTTLNVASFSTGAVRTPVIERSDTYVNRFSQARIVGDQVIWSSERDGWNHLYRLSALDGAVQQQLTRGEWAVRELVHVDARRRYVYFVAGGREKDQDPYYRHLYRVKLDGTGLSHLTPEPVDHSVAVSPTGNYFIDTHSRLDSAPVTVLRHADGRKVRELQRADITALQAAGWKPPRLFTVKARDGKTDLYGAMFLPSRFDPAIRYPVLDSIYPGPQSIKTCKSFGGWEHQSYDGWENEQALAELGFVVVTIDGMGTPFRSKAFRDLSYRNLGSAGGLEDHVAGLRQLAGRFSFLDLTRVGIYGHSGGGYASVRAMLAFPEFYKVAVSTAGNHDQRSYWAEWGERFQAWPVNDESYLNQANAPLAGRLRGKLLLMYGDLDDNVHPSGTLQLVDALIAANKNFDLLVLPNRNHLLVNLAAGKAALRREDPYSLRRRWDYFVEHLLGAEPPNEFRLELQSAFPD